MQLILSGKYFQKFALVRMDFFIGYISFNWLRGSLEADASQWKHKPQNPLGNTLFQFFGNTPPAH